MKTIVIIQARMGSSRLPGKVLLPLGERTVLENVVERSRLISGVSHVIVATSTLFGDDAIVQWCREHKVTCFRGSEEDVLARYYECAKEYSPDYVIRITADCPYVDYQLASSAVEAVIKQPSDLVVFSGEMPRGLVSEVISFEALQRIYRVSHENRHREHVTYYAYEYPEQFTRIEVQTPKSLLHPELRITLDTEDDYKLCKAIADGCDHSLEVSSEEVVAFLVDHPEIAALNAHIEQKPVV
jgi:spore coat polysaccharide biosynthesis protein SpsF